MNADIEIPLTSSMDRRIKERSKKPVLLASTFVVVAIPIVIYWLSFDPSSSFTVDDQHIRIDEVRTGIFEDYIPLRAAIEPEHTVYLDAMEGGQVEAVHVEEGAMVEKNQSLLELSNTTLQLDVIAREAQVSEQLNNLRNTQLAIEQNRIKLKSDLIEIDYQILRLERLIRRYEKLSSDQFIAKDEYESSLDELNYWKSRQAVTRESRAQDTVIRVAQLEQLNNSIAQLEQNLVLARTNLSNLLIRAPRSGRLTSFNVGMGESKARGERLGQIDDVDRFKAVAFVNEFYLNRVRVGQQAMLSVDGHEYALEISKIYPQVRSAQFEVDLRFHNGVPPDMRRGQTLQLRLVLSDTNNLATLLANGPYFNDTGGVWVFALNADGKGAHRRTVQFGRRNPKHVEIESGLEPGERVVVSSYASFISVEKLLIDQ